MSIEAYQRLYQGSKESDVVPQLTSAAISITGTTATLEQVVQRIGEFQAYEGWYSSRDQVVINASLLNPVSLLEGEWYRDGQSLQVKLIADDCYRVIQISPISEGDTLQVYSAQKIYLRDTLKQEGVTQACYRLWWQREQQGEQEGRWLPLVQQFVGFCFEGSAI
ncbi:hypothetical protein C9426_32705 [Serratia sp. S1B]|nr:hypothetical protein C9426_32705 [Serratia sp. S1B]